MAQTETESGSAKEHVDPVLAQLIESATFECDWPTLRHHLYLALLAAAPVFQERGPPPSQAGVVPISAVSPGTGGRGEERGDDGRVITPPPGEGECGDPSLRPTTPGGLVIPPFPPLDPNRRRPNVTVITASESRINGTPVTTRGNPFEDEWDEEVIIGGRKLPGWLDDDEAKKQIDDVARKIEDLEVPPFTVQRLAELLAEPTRLHSTLGKFLRAVEKMLSVTTAWAPPSYTYVAPPAIAPMEGIPGSPSAASAASSSSDMDVDSTVPPGSMTPMFSPIPFLSSGDADALGEPMVDVEGGADEGLMSPLMLGGSSGMFAQQQGAGGRSPTPEPEDDGGAAGAATEGSGSEGAGASETPAAAPTTAASAVADAGADAADGEAPGRMPYLGRVDELDSGPITSNGHNAEDAHEDAATGLGEAGNMTPHGMSDRPVPLSSTTVITEDEREIAPLPRRSEDGGRPSLDAGEGAPKGTASERAESAATSDADAAPSKTGGPQAKPSDADATSDPKDGASEGEAKRSDASESTDAKASDV